MTEPVFDGVYRRNRVTAALRESLAAAITVGGDPVAVGKGDVPNPVPPAKTPKVPYLVVYELAGGGYWGALRRPERSVVYLYRVRAVGETEEQASWLAGRVRSHILGRDTRGRLATEIAAEGLVVKDRWPEGSPGGVEKTSGLFQSEDDFALAVVPS